MQVLILAMCVLLLLSSETWVFAQTPRTPQPPAIEFRGWDYARLGHSISPGEEMSLLFLNDQTEMSRIPVTWKLTTYVGETLTQGEMELSMDPGEIGQVPISLPSELEDGAYFIQYTLGDSTRPRERRIHFDFRRPMLDRTLNLNMVALVENMDAEGWTRMMLGPLARYVNILSDWPAVQETNIDVVLVIAEVLKEDDARLARLREYVQQGGKMLVFGKPAASLYDMLPIHLAEDKPWQETPLRLRPLPGGPWQDFQPDAGLTHYGIRIKAKENADVLAEWYDGAPAVVSWAYGKGKVVFVGAGSGQVWQRRASLEGSDEMGLRLLYWLTGGEETVTAMLDRAEQLLQKETQARTETLKRVFADLQVKPPRDYVVVNRGNMGRFGWLIEEGGLTESINANGVVTPVATRSFRLRGGARWSIDREASFSMAIGDDQTPQATGVVQNWLSKTITWRYKNGDTINSTLSLASPGILWEGKSTNIWITCKSATHVAYVSPKGIQIATRNEVIDPMDLAEAWLLLFRADPEVRDMPQLIVLTHRPEGISFTEGIRFSYSEKTFGALFTSRLWGIRRLSPGETASWTKDIPRDALAAARQWSRAFLAYPVECDEIGWVEEDTVVLADRFRFRNFDSDWNAEPLKLSTLPPVLPLAKSVGAPVQLPEERVDLKCATKFGPLEAVSGDTTIVRIPMPPRDHRAIVPAEGRMVLQEAIDERVQGLGLGRKRHPDQTRNEGAGDLHADLAMYDISNTLPFNEAPCIDVYKWWLTFNSILARPVYSDPMRDKVDQHFRSRYWETLNFYPHKCFVWQKREPWTGVEYIISFVWPTQTQYGFRNFNDGNEASGVNAYCFSSYARYYGDWATLRANWNHCRRLYEYLPKVNDWACMASGALEYWRVAGLDMLNSEPYGNLAFAYAAKNAGYPQDELVGLVLGARSLVPSVARLGLQRYLHSITSEGDPWREFQGFYHFTEDGIQASTSKMGAIGMLDTSKGTHHELALAYKAWAPERTREEEKALEAAQRNSLPNLTQRLFLGWEPAVILDQARTSKPRSMNWTAAKDLYDLALACIGDIPLFLSDWAPAEYVSGLYHPDRQELSLVFRSYEGEPYQVRIYSQRAPQEVIVNDEELKRIDDAWRYDTKSGWLVINLQGTDEKRLNIRLGDPVAPLHPYFTEVSE